MAADTLQRHLPESLTIPNEYAVDLYRGEMGQLALRLTTTPGVIPYQPDEGIVYRDVQLNDERIGDYCLGYDYSQRKINTTHVFIPELYRGKGLGSALYRTALHVPLPSGEPPREHGFYLESKYPNNTELILWESFVSRGIAERGTETSRHYIMR